MMFILGLFVGALVGTLVVGMCVAAKQSEHGTLVESHAESIEEHPTESEA